MKSETVNPYPALSSKLIPPQPSAENVTMRVAWMFLWKMEMRVRPREQAPPDRIGCFLTCLGLTKQ